MSRLLFLGVGAAFMYFCDPQAGRKRRTDLRNRVEATQRRIAHARGVVARDATQRTHGVLLEARRALEAARTRDAPGLVPYLRSLVAPWGQPRWSPAQRAVAGACGAGLAAYGFVRGGLRGMAWSAIGGGLLARATTNEPLAAAASGFLVEKTVRVQAPVDEVFAYWRQLENLPQWMSHVREVRDLGGERYHWVVDGPAGIPVEWDSELLNVAPGHEMTWRSCEGSQVHHTGRVRFEADGAGTRVHVQLRYQPPGGAIGHVVAKAFGVDPRTEMADDLARMKRAIEGGRPARDAAAQQRLNGGDGAVVR